MDTHIAYSILVCGTMATAAMTLFSYIVSYIKKENYREPIIIALLIQKLFPRLRLVVSFIMGWLLHYLVGLVFVTVYVLLWQYQLLKHDAIVGILLGLLSGFVGIVIWHITLKFHPNPPEIKIGQYYGHLLLAHIVFGVCASLVYE